MTDCLVIAYFVADITVDTDGVVVAGGNNSEVEGLIAKKAAHANMAG
jgi:hypothetical protein